MRRAAVIFLLAALGLLAWIYWQKSRPEPFVVSGFIESDEIRVGSRIGGRIAEVVAYEGQRVKAGDTLFRIEPFDLQEQLAQARGSLAANTAEHDRLAAGFRKEEIEQVRAKRDQAKATLDRLVTGPRPQEIEVAREEVKTAQANVDFAESEYARLDRLKGESQAAPREFDEANRAMKAGRATLVQAQKQLALLEEGTRKEEIAGARASLAEAQAAASLAEEGYRKETIAQAAAEVEASKARVAAIEKQLAELNVTAPTECVVEAVDLRPGDIIAPNAPGLSLLETAKMWVRAYVPEARLGQVRLDMKVPVRVDSFPDRTFAGRVSFIAHEAEFTPKNVQTPEERSKQVFRVKVTLTEGMDLLRVGMAADLLLDEATQ